MNWLPAVAIVALLGRDIEAQVVVGGDSVPKFGFAINRAAIAVGLRPLRASGLAPGEREVRISGIRIGIPYSLYRVHASGGNVRGALVLFGLT